MKNKFVFIKPFYTSLPQPYLLIKTDWLQAHHRFHHSVNTGDETDFSSQLTLA